MKTRNDHEHDRLAPGPRGTSALDPFHANERADEDDDDDDNEKKDEARNAHLDQDLLKARTILVSGQVDDKLCASLVARCLILENRDPDAPITVFINSPGGSADSGFAMYDILRFVKCPIRTVVNGLCASAAVMVYLGGDKESRLSLPGSRFLLHQPSTMSRGSASDLRITAEQIVRIRERYNSIVSEATGKSTEEILEASERDFWLSADEALEFGLVDRIVTSKTEL